jgi:hypothetical protein
MVLLKRPSAGYPGGGLFFAQIFFPGCPVEIFLPPVKNFK